MAEKMWMKILNNPCIICDSPLSKYPVQDKANPWLSKPVALINSLLIQNHTGLLHQRSSGVRGRVEWHRPAKSQTLSRNSSLSVSDIDCRISLLRRLSGLLARELQNEVFPHPNVSTELVCKARSLRQCDVPGLTCLCLKAHRRSLPGDRRDLDWAALPEQKRLAKSAYDRKPAASVRTMSKSLERCSTDAPMRGLERANMNSSLLTRPSRSRSKARKAAATLPPKCRYTVDMISSLLCAPVRAASEGADQGDHPDRFSARTRNT